MGTKRFGILLKQRHLILDNVCDRGNRIGPPADLWQRIRHIATQSFDQSGRILVRLVQVK